MQTRVRLEIASRGRFAEGMPFGDVGPYERLAGRAVFGIDPEEPSNRGMVDLALAPRDHDGLVTYAADLFILMPADLARGNRRILYDVHNRGDKRALQFFNDAAGSNDPATAAHAGNGYLMRRGYTVVWSGWQGDLLPGDGRLTMTLPVAGAAEGGLTGLTRAELIVEEAGVRSLPLSGNAYTRSYETVSLDTASTTFTYREYETDPRTPIAPDAWRFATLDRAGVPVTSAAHCYLPSGFRPGWIYELVYTAKSPPVMGLGFACVRDLLSFLLHDDTDADGVPNPLRRDGVGIEQVYGWGRSQSGRFLRSFVHGGFNSDARGRRVFSAIWPHVAGGGRLALNARFAQPGRFPRHHADHLYPSDQFPFAYPITTDPLTHQTDGILTRPETDPLVIHSQTAAEYWARRGSLVHTDAQGEDLAEHERARVYHFAGSQHRAWPNGLPETGPHQHLSNPLNTTPLLRALLDALDAWATHGTPPPDSRVPRRSDGTLVRATEVCAGFPAIPGVCCPGEANRLFVQDHGPDADQGLFTVEPPLADRTREYAVLVPGIDADGNEVAGIRMPALQVPLATYTGWNLRPLGAAERAPAGITGSYFPFASTKKERRATGDPRLSIEERYGSRARYVRAIAMATQRLVDDRLMLGEDADRIVAEAMAAPEFA
jgi:hypothetical protein